MEQVHVVRHKHIAAVLSRPKVPWRYAVYYAFFAGLPEILNVVGTYGTNFRLGSMVGQNPSLTVILFPVGRILVLLTATAAMFGYAGTHLKSKKEMRTKPRTVS